MATLKPEFTQGYKARYDCGRLLEYGNKPDCPYYASSPAGDAWEAGWSFASDEMAGNKVCQSAIRKVWHGRGYTVNVQTLVGKIVYDVTDGHGRLVA